jgi:hypothetical protein
MAAFIGVVIINNYRYLLHIQYIERDMMVSPLTIIKVYSIWTYQTCYNQLSLFHAQEEAAKLILVLKVYVVLLKQKLE